MFSSALASPEFEGRGGEELGHHLAHMLAQAYSHHSTLNRDGLCIVPGQQCWILYIDVVVRPQYDMHMQSFTRSTCTFYVYDVMHNIFSRISVTLEN